MKMKVGGYLYVPAALPVPMG